MGSVNLDNTGSGSAITLSSDGTSLLLDGTAIGGGGSLDLYAETYNGTSTKPSVSGGTNSISIGQNSVSSGNKSIALGAYSVASGLQSTAVGYVCSASGTADYAAGTGGSASGGYGVAISGVSSASKGVAIGLHSGHSKARATGVSAVALNGSRASGVDSFAVSVTNDSTSYGASGANSIAIGQLSKATQANSIAIGDTAISTTANQIALGGATDTVKISTLHETVGTISSGTINLATGNVFADAPSANATYVFSNPAASGLANGFTLKITPSATVTITWPTSVDWASGTAPTAPASGATNVYTFYTADGGTTYYGFLAGGAMA